MDISTWGRAERAVVFWMVAALLALIPVTLLLEASFPVFTVVWLVVPLAGVLRTDDAARVGFRPIPWGQFARFTAIALVLLALLMALFEPWSHTYRQLIALATSEEPPDSTFAWLVRYDGAAAWAGLLAYSGLVTIWAEELFFRGWLLQALRRHMHTVWAVILQGALFAVPNILAALAMGPLQGALFVVVYAWLAIGIVGGWAAACTRSIWPSLAAATLTNLVLTALVW